MVIESLRVLRVLIYKFKCDVGVGVISSAQIISAVSRKCNFFLNDEKLLSHFCSSIILASNILKFKLADPATELTVQENVRTKFVRGTSLPFYE